MRVGTTPRLTHASEDDHPDCSSVACLCLKINMEGREAGGATFGDGTNPPSPLQGTRPLSDLFVMKTNVALSTAEDKHEVTIVGGDEEKQRGPGRKCGAKPRTKCCSGLGCTGRGSPQAGSVVRARLWRVL